MNSQFDALIFDCDGVLVDSEVLAQEVELTALAGIGLQYERGEFTRRFTGTSAEDMNKAVAQDYEARFGHNIPADFFDKLRALIQDAYEQHLQPIDGAVDLAKSWPRAKAVASSSSHALVRLKLDKVGLRDTFDPHVYTADQARAKPHPDLFLMAAEALAVAPAQSLVIEDSVNGVLAAKRAGMTVIGFTGGAHCCADHAIELAQNGADLTFAGFNQITSFLLDQQ